MKRRLFFLLLCLLAPPAFAGSALVADRAWVREAPPGARMMAAFLVFSLLAFTGVLLFARSYRRVPGADWVTYLAWLVLWFWSILGYWQFMSWPH